MVVHLMVHLWCLSVTSTIFAFNIHKEHQLSMPGAGMEKHTSLKRACECVFKKAAEAKLSLVVLYLGI